MPTPEKAPKLAAPKKLKARAGTTNSDLKDRIVSSLRKIAPRKKDAGSIEVCRTNKEILSRVRYVLTTGIEPFDTVVGGFPFGRVTELYGLESCVSSDTFIHYCLCDADGKIQNSKGGTIEKLWHRFHGKEMGGKGHDQRDATLGAEFFIPSVNSEDAIFRNRIVDVVDTGVKECFEVKTKRGFSIKATADHKFYTGTHYALLSDLRVGSQVMVHNNTPFTGRAESGTYAASTLKYYYKGFDKNINGYHYKVEYDHRLAIEASLNGMTLGQYKDLLNSGITKLPDNFITLPEDTEVHHIDEDRRNNSIENLELLGFSKHGHNHAIKNHNKLRFIAVADEVVSITPVGELKTYDIKCVFPHNNYVAAGFVVHNCGKTAVVMRSAVRAQKREIYERIKVEDGDTNEMVLRRVPEDTDVTVLYIDNEQSLEDDDKIVIEGVEIDAVLARCDTVELLFKTIDRTLDDIAEFEVETKRKQFVVVIVDTIAGTSSKEEMTQDWGKDDYSRQPKQLRQAFRRMTRKINRQNVCMICTNQVSDSYKVAAAGKKNKSNLPRDNDFGTFGGRALKFYTTVRIFMFKMPDNKYILVKGAQFAAGFLVGFFTSKNRQVKPLREGRMVLLFDRGLDNTFSLLESLIYYGFAVYDKDTGGFSFRFKAWNIQTDTFGEASIRSVIDLEEGDSPAESRSERKKNPFIESRSEWPAFYASHKSDFDKMWVEAKKYIFATEGLGGFVASREDAEDDSEGED